MAVRPRKAGAARKPPVAQLKLNMDDKGPPIKGVRRALLL